MLFRSHSCSWVNMHTLGKYAYNWRMDLGQRMENRLHTCGLSDFIESKFSGRQTYSQMLSILLKTFPIF